MVSATIDRTRNSPLHQQVSDHIEELIESGTMVEGDELPAESELAKHYEVSRSVVRQALSRLVLKDLIETRKGRPAIVVGRPKRTPVRDVSRAGGLAEEIREQGKELLTRVLSFSSGEPSSFLRDKLFLQECWEIHRLRLIEDRPILYVINWVPKELLPNLKEEDIRQRSLHDVIRDTGVELEGGKRHITAVGAEDPVASQLDVSIGAPLLRVTGETRTTRNSIAEGFTLWHHPSFDLEINASTGPVTTSQKTRRIERAMEELNDAVSSVLSHQTRLVDRQQ
ncbi:GntR family transcriptional regulator [Corynebacterium sp.]|uniref:GntR family transcriptional regulator n=1 Tax=Corynebacterium sp. TaxID=1720 RepID=UPI0028A70703|nr:GntR family transcriptional regulator [Corynebacterium sp.]